MKKNILKIERILDFYDVPQLFVGRDVFDTQYMCLLYDDEPQCRYTAIKISSEQFAHFVQNKIDLRKMFQNPELGKNYYDVIFDGENHIIDANSMNEIPEDRMPAEGYMYDQKENEVLTVTIPKRERNFFFQLMHRHGWVAM